MTCRRKSLFKGMIVLVLLGFCLGLSSSTLWGKLLFEKSEYASRRTKLMEMIPDGAAIIWGAQRPSGYYPFFQNNDSTALNESNPYNLL